MGGSCKTAVSINHPGEKLYEELITEGEGIVKTPHEKLFVLRANSNIDPVWLGQKIKELALLAQEQDAQGIKSKLQEIVPDTNSLI
jgi:FlaA1/EpsC-like NDP-sugar epimerase